MSIGIIEVVFSVCMFSLIWFFIFKAKVKYDKKKLKKDLHSNLEKQEGKEFLIQGRKVKVGSQVDIEQIETIEDIVKKPVKKKPVKKKAIKKKVVKKKKAIKKKK